MLVMTTGSPSPILAPLVALVAWTFVMWAWMYATRVPAIMKMRMKPDPNMPRGEQMALLPAEVRWKADNYNHLLEMPTLFYAIVITLALVGRDQGLALGLAWAYVGLRVIHSVFQATVNKIEVRFVLFTLSSLVLAAMTLVAALAFF